MRDLSGKSGTLNDIGLNFALCRIRAGVKRTYKGRETAVPVLVMIIENG